VKKPLVELRVWLEADEAKSRPHRAKRLQSLLEIFSTNESEVMFRGRTVSFSIYTELRLAFIHGLFLTTFILALACIEQELAGALYARGTNQAARDTLDNLLRESLAIGEIDAPLFESITKLKDLRNSTAHYRPPLHEKGAVRRAIREDKLLHELSLEEATFALTVLASFINRGR
jgi:hypothetical protein